MGKIILFKINKYASHPKRENFHHDQARRCPKTTCWKDHRQIRNQGLQARRYEAMQTRKATLRATLRRSLLKGILRWTYRIRCLWTSRRYGLGRRQCRQDW